MMLSNKYRVGLALVFLSSAAFAEQLKIDNHEEKKNITKKISMHRKYLNKKSKNIFEHRGIGKIIRSLIKRRKNEVENRKLKKTAKTNATPKVNVDEAKINSTPTIKTYKSEIIPDSKQVLSPKDPYDAKSDLNSFIRKLRIDDGFVIKNETDQKMNLRLKLESKDNLGFFKKETIDINPFEYYVFDKKENIQLSRLKVLNNSFNKYLNPKFTEDGFLQINIEDEQDRHFLHQSHKFDFTSKKFTQEELTDSSLSQEERDFRRDFNGSCEYLDFMTQQEGISLHAIDQQRQELYAKNSIGALLEKDPNLLDSANNKIPLITHKIWVTSDDAPKDPSPQYIKWLENSIEHNKISEGWIHYFWIESKQKLPNLAKLLENHPTIKLMELNELDKSDFVTGDLYQQAIKNKKFGKATDIIRLELLRKMGGFYLDTDYELFQSLKPYSKAYDLFMGLEPMSVYLCNAFMGARQNHPVVNKSLEMILRNLGPEAPEYVKNAPENGFKTIIETGPALVTAAFGLTAGQGDNVDIVLPPQTIYPATADVYPKKQVVVPNGKMPTQAIGAHYWNTAWMDPQFGSQG